MTTRKAEAGCLLAADRDAVFIEYLIGFGHAGKPYILSGYGTLPEGTNGVQGQMLVCEGLSGDWHFLSLGSHDWDLWVLFWRTFNFNEVLGTLILMGCYAPLSQII